MSDYEDGPEAATAGSVGDEHSQAMEFHDKILSLDHVAKMFGVSRLALRYYEYLGLIKRRHRAGNVRSFGWADCDRIALIIKCRRAGLKLRDFVPILDAVDGDVPISEARLQQQACTTLTHHLERRRRVLDEALAELNLLNSLLGAKSGQSDPG